MQLKKAKSNTLLSYFVVNKKARIDETNDVNESYEVSLILKS